MTGFEPATYASQTQRSTRLSYTPMRALCRIVSPPDWRDKRGGFALASAAVGDVWLGHGLVFGWFSSRDVMRAMPRPALGEARGIALLCRHRLGRFTAGIEVSQVGRQRRLGVSIVGGWRYFWRYVNFPNMTIAICRNGFAALFGCAHLYKAQPSPAGLFFCLKARVAVVMPHAGTRGGTA